MGVLAMERRAVLQLLSAGASTLATGSALAQSRAIQLVVIIAKDSPLQNIDLMDLRRVFGGDPLADPSGRNLVPLNHPARSPDRVGFDRIVLGMDPDQVGKYWVDRRIRGQPGPPRTVPSLQVLLGVVSRLPGAIGYLRAQYLSPEVRPLSVSGKAPSTPGYPLFYTE